MSTEPLSLTNLLHVARSLGARFHPADASLTEKDLAQIVALTLLEHKEQIAAAKDPLKYAKAIGWNVLKNIYNEAKAHPQISFSKFALDDAEDDDDAEFHDGSWIANGAPSEAGQRALRDRRRERVLGAVGEAVNQLPEVQQNVIMLRFWENNTFDEIANNLGITRQQAQEILRLSLTKLRALLAELEGYQGFDLSEPGWVENFKCHAAT